MSRETEQIYWLPRPPSVNALYRNVVGKGRAKTKLYKTWIKAAGWELDSQGAVAISGPVSIDIAVSEVGGPKTEDLDNKAKAILDLLVTHKVIEGDAKPYVREIRLHWLACVVEGVNVTVRAAA